MKNYLKVIVVAFSLLLVVNINALADTLPSNVVLEGNANGIVFIPDDRIFLYKDNMVPGDEVDRTMTIDNKYDAPFDVYMRAERITPKEQYDLLTKLNLKITYKGNVIYEGPVSGEDGLVKNISLGSYKPGDTAQLHAEVKWEGKDSGNEYMNKTAQVKWIFTAQTKGTVVPASTNSGAATAATVQPYTGDNSIIPYVIIFACASSVLIILLVVKKKMNREV